VNPVSILIIDDDEASQAALRQVLDSDGWKLQIVPLAHQALAELASTNWTLVIVNVAMTGLDGPLFSTLKELALAAAVEAGRTRARVLFLVPELAGPVAQPALERERLPYSLKPFHLHDFLEKVSDLLLETNAIPAPIRRVRYEYKGPDRRGKDRRSGRDRRETAMFASRADYMMSEEEIAEFERQEEEERKKKKKQPTRE
jgi:DNA-binding NtrC family response regulator